MNAKTAKRLRKEARERGDPATPKQYTTPFTMDIKGTQTHIPRHTRRLLMRRFLADLKKGRIKPNDRPE